MNISLCITVLNEERWIGKLLDSIFSGSKKPDEVVIIDGGSVDKTVEIINHYQKKFRCIKLLVEKGTIAHGRNVAIDIAKNKIIVQTDAGCLVKKDWLEKITQPFENGHVDIVAGFYEMPASSSLQAAINVFHGVPPKRFNPTSFLPSARSVAFKKEVWERIGGFNEKLHGAGEDTLFFDKAVKIKFRFVRVGEAKVIWEEIKNITLMQAATKFCSYAKGDAETKIWWNPIKQFTSHNIKIAFIFLRYLLAIILVLLVFWNKISPLVIIFLFVAYLLYPICKWRDVIKDGWGRLWLPVIQITSDIAVMCGFIKGISSSIMKQT